MSPEDDHGREPHVPGCRDRSPPGATSGSAYPAALPSRVSPPCGAGAWPSTTRTPTASWRRGHTCSPPDSSATWCRTEVQAPRWQLPGAEAASTIPCAYEPIPSDATTPLAPGDRDWRTDATITSLQNLDPTPPSASYLRTMLNGLGEAFGGTEEERANYLLAAPGVRPGVDGEPTRRLVRRWRRPLTGRKTRHCAAVFRRRLGR